MQFRPISKARLRMIRRSLFGFIGASFSIWLQGFHYGINNNVFHILIVEKYHERPQFQDDATVQSVHSFVAPLYHLLAIFDTAAGSILPVIFLILHLIARWGLYVLIMRAACHLADRDDVKSDLMVLFVMWSSIAFGYSPLGFSGLQINYFTHSELALTISLWAIDRLREGRILQAGWIIALLALT